MTRALLLAFSVFAFITATPALAQDATRHVAQTNEVATRGPKDASAIGALLEFAYERGALYAVEASPQRITDIALEPGETLLSVSAGDTTRWIVGDAHSGFGATSQAHVLVKPNAANLATNLVVMTDRRVYHIQLKSLAGAAMAAVSWRYPAVMMLVDTPAPVTMPPAPPPPAFTPAKLNLRYRIEGDKPAWRPLAAFDDGQQTFIEMPAKVKTMEAPPLFIVGDEGPELVNYRVQDQYYVVDRLFMKAELRLGTGWSQKKVQIVRQTPITGGAHD